MTLLINTTDRYSVELGLREGQQVVSNMVVELAGKTDQQLLPLIDQLLQDCKLSQSQIDQIEVVPGPGSFTGTRVGVAVANALALAWGIPINGMTDSFVEPVYASQPHITPRRVDN